MVNRSHCILRKNSGQLMKPLCESLRIYGAANGRRAIRSSEIPSRAFNLERVSFRLVSHLPPIGVDQSLQYPKP